ncbi:MAG: Smr/MutS family protein [Acidobacteriota bacterium]
MDDDEVFERSMASMGVEPLDEEGGRRLRRRRDDLAESDQQLFESALRDLGDRRRGERRRTDRSGSDRRQRARRQSVPRVKVRGKNLRIDEQLDLHRLRTAEALTQLDRFVVDTAGAGRRTVLVITGKGHHSPGGRGIIKQRVEEWIQGRGRAFLRAFGDAPRTFGGRGAYVLFLKRGD